MYNKAEWLYMGGTSDDNDDIFQDRKTKIDDALWWMQKYHDEEGNISLEDVRYCLARFGIHYLTPEEEEYVYDRA